MRILVVDDSRISRRALLRVLRREGEIEVAEAANGQEAVDAFAQQRFDLVFMDLTMPVMSGYDACRAITDADPSARVAIVSADIQPMARERCRDAGAFAFVSKPIARSQIHALVSGEAEKIAC